MINMKRVLSLAAVLATAALPALAQEEAVDAGWWLPGRGTVFATTDTGRTWVPYRLAG